MQMSVAKPEDGPPPAPSSPPLPPPHPNPTRPGPAQVCRGPTSQTGRGLCTGSVHKAQVGSRPWGAQCSSRRCIWRLDASRLRADISPGPSTAGRPYARPNKPCFPPSPATPPRSVLEERARVLGRQLSRLPVSMAETGEIPVSERQIMQAGGAWRGGGGGPQRGVPHQTRAPEAAGARQASPPCPPLAQRCAYTCTCAGTRMSGVVLLATAPCALLHSCKLACLGFKCAAEVATQTRMHACPLRRQARCSSPPQHVGTLFQSMSAVNLLGRVLDTPASITSAPDNIGSLYKSVS